MIEATNKVDKFGMFLVDNLRDKGIDFADKILQQHWKATVFQIMQKELGELSHSKKEFIRDAVTAAFDSAIHDFLFALQERNDIKILVDNENIVELSDGIHGEAFSDEGWYAKYSKYKTLF